MNLDAIDSTPLSNVGVAMEVMHPNGLDPLKNEEGQPVTITLLGSDSEAYQTIARRLMNERVHRNRVAGRPMKDVAEEQARGDLELLAGATVGWSGIADANGPIAFSKEAAKLLYTKYPWIREQADNFVGTRANFLKKASVD